MKKVLSLIVSILIPGIGLFVPGTESHACTRTKPFTLDELFNNADVIVRATAVRYAIPPDDPRSITTGEPRSTVEFRIEETLRGDVKLASLVVNGYLNDKDDFNELPIPYMLVRPYGRRGSCFANTYKVGAQFLLFLQKTKNGFTPNISALGPSNEQLFSENDPWLLWVRDHLKALERRETASNVFRSDLLRSSWFSYGCLLTTTRSISSTKNPGDVLSRAV